MQLELHVQRIQYRASNLWFPADSCLASGCNHDCSLYCIMHAMLTSCRTAIALYATHSTDTTVWQWKSDNPSMCLHPLIISQLCCIWVACWHVFDCMCLPASVDSNWKPSHQESALLSQDARLQAGEFLLHGSVNGRLWYCCACHFRCMMSWVRMFTHLLIHSLTQSHARMYCITEAWRTEKTTTLEQPKLQTLQTRKTLKEDDV